MRVTFRAQFQGPKGALNPSGFAMPLATVNVEVFRKGDSWFARTAERKAVLLYQLNSHPTHGCAKDAVMSAFDKQLSKWQLHDTDGNPLDPDSVTEDPNGNFERRESTHIGVMGAGAQGKSGPNYFNTVCGSEVHVHLIRSVRSKNPPDCKHCRVEWEKVKPEDRLK